MHALKVDSLVAPRLVYRRLVSVGAPWFSSRKNRRGEKGRAEKRRKEPSVSSSLTKLRRPNDCNYKRCSPRSTLPSLYPTPQKRKENDLARQARRGSNNSFRGRAVKCIVHSRKTATDREATASREFYTVAESLRARILQARTQRAASSTRKSRSLSRCRETEQ